MRTNASATIATRPPAAAEADTGLFLIACLHEKVSVPLPFFDSASAFVGANLTTVDIVLPALISSGVSENLSSFVPTSRSP